MPVRVSTPDEALDDESATKTRAEQVRALVDDHFDFIWRLLRRTGLSAADADDATQHVFMTATQKLDDITSGSERTYLYGVALRVAANWKRKRTRRGEDQQKDERELHSTDPAPDEAAALGEARALLDELLATLPPELRRVLVLAEIAQLEVAQIAEVEGLAVGTAASRLRRARLAFKSALQRAGSRNPFGGSP
jgi:RNA polymerase sigma-70 factor (ECF subfamily)